MHDNNPKTSKPENKPVMVYDVDQQTWRSARAEAYRVGRRMGAVVSEALKLWLEKTQEAA